VEVLSLRRHGAAASSGQQRRRVQSNQVVDAAKAANGPQGDPANQELS